MRSSRKRSKSSADSHTSTMRHPPSAGPEVCTISPAGGPATALILSLTPSYISRLTPGSSCVTSTAIATSSVGNAGSLPQHLAPARRGGGESGCRGREARDVDADHLQPAIQRAEREGVGFLHRVVEDRVAARVCAAGHEHARGKRDQLRGAL